MPLFFFISGMLFVSGKYSFKKFLKKRFFQLFFPLVIFTGILNLFVFKEFVWYQPFGLLWFLIILFLSEIIYFVLDRTSMGGVTSVCLIALAFLLQYLNIKLPFSLSSLPICLSFYIVGNKLKEKIFTCFNGTSSKIYLFLGIGSYIILAVFVYCVNQQTAIYDNSMSPFLTGLICLLIGTVGTFATAKFIDLSFNIEHKFVKEIMLSIGANTMVIYLMHPIAIKLISNLKTYLTSLIMYELVKFTLIILFLWFCVTIVDKTCLKYLFGKR